MPWASKICESDSLNVPFTKERTDNPICTPEVKRLRSQSVHPIHRSLHPSQIQLNESMKRVNKTPMSIESG